MKNTINTKFKMMAVVAAIILCLSLVLAGCSQGEKEEPQEEAVTPAATEEDKKEEKQEEEKKEEKEEAKEETEPKAEEVTPEEENNNDEANGDKEKRKAVYSDALLNLYENHIDPEGNAINCDGDFSKNTFAVVDINGDGYENLIFDFTETDMASQSETIYYYSNFVNLTERILLTGPYNEYYTNGFIKSNASHNHSLSLDFWPYTLYHYSEYAGEYVPVASLHAWDISMAEEDYDGNPFPDEIDQDGDGIVYYVIEDRVDYGEEGPQPMDLADQEAWVNQILNGASPIQINKLPLTEENIRKYIDGSSYVTE